MEVDSPYSYTRNVIFASRVTLSTPLVVAAWSTLAIPLLFWAIAVSQPAAWVFGAATLLLWAAGLRAAALWMRAGAASPRPHVHPDRADLRVAVLICVADDLDVAAAAATIRQDVPVDAVILDDSRDAAERARVDAFAATHGCEVIRRADRLGYKAGNLNHAVAALRGRFDAYLICDSDVVLPPDLVRLSSDALADPTVAVAQASPVAARGRTRFARYFGPLLATHLGVTRRGRGAHGITVFLGRGALVRAAAIDDVGGFPHAVAEDLAMTVALRRRGWRLVDVDVAFTEDYPIDYRAFRTQLRKTAEGSVEFLRRPGRLRGLRTREAADVILETSLVPLTALSGAVALVSGAALAAGGVAPPVWAMAVSALSALAPLLPEAVRRAREERLAAGVVFALAGGALYASTMFVVLSAVLRTLAGRRAVFWVTPKRTARLGAAAWLGLLRAELVLVPLLMAAAVAASGSALSAAAPLGPLLLVLAFCAATVVRPRPTVDAVALPAREAALVA